MFIPSVFYGTLKETKARYKKINTRLLKGSSLEECVSKFELLDTDSLPEALLWVDKAWSMEGSRNHFTLCEFGYSLVNDDRLEKEIINKIIDDNLEYLTKTPWGALIINSTQCHFWSLKLPFTAGLRFNGFECIIKAFVQHYNELASLGDRYFSGGSGGGSFGDLHLQIIYVICHCGNEYSSFIERIIKEDKSVFYKKIFDLINSENILKKINNGEIIIA